MRFSVSVICIVLIGLAFSSPVESQAQVHSIGGPMLGFVSDHESSTIWPIIGIPGASLIGDGRSFEGIRGLVISPNSDYAVALRIEDSQLVVADLSSEAPAFSSVAGLNSGTDLIALSPSGSTVAAYDEDSRIVQVVGGLANAPELVGAFDASRISGRVVSLIVSDDGAVSVLKTIDVDGPAMWVIASSGASWRVPADHPSVAAFVPNSYDVIVADDATRSAFLISDALHAGLRTPLFRGTSRWGSFSSVAASRDGKSVFLASANSDIITIVNRETMRPSFVSCKCRATGFYPLKGTAVFRLDEPSREPMTVLDASSSRPRIAVIPPNASMTGQQQ